MPKYIVDFTHADLGTVGKAEEHNYTEFEFTLNEDFQKCDFIIIEFGINGKKIMQDSVTISENQAKITFALPQQLTLPGNHHVQLVGFVVNKENSEPICIMKSDVIHFTIEQSISGTKQKADSNPSLLDTIISKIHKLMELAHFHHNKKTLDAITEELIELGTTPEIPLVYALPENPKAGNACRLIRSEITAADGGRAVVFDYANLKKLVEIGETHYNKVNYTINVNADEYSAWLRISVSYSYDEVKITVDRYNSLYDSYEGDYEQWENIFFLNNDSEWEFSTADNNAAFTPSYYYNSKTNTTTHLLEPLASVNIPDEYISSVTVEKDIDINIFDINIFHLEPIIMLYDGEWRAVANESLLYQQKGATISKHEIIEKNDGSKFFRLYLDWGKIVSPLTTKRWIDIPIEEAKDITDPGIGTQSTGIQLQLGGDGSTKTIPIVSTLPETAKDGDVVLYRSVNTTAFWSKPRFMYYQSGAWKELYCIPTKLSELENDSGFITAEDIPQGNLSQFIEETASSVNLYPPMVDGFVNSAILSSGAISTNTKNNSYVTPLISIEPNTTYSINDVFAWGVNTGLADRNKGRTYTAENVVLSEMVFTHNADGSYTFTTPEGASYIRFMGYKAGLGTSSTAPIETVIELFNNQFMLVKGTTIPSVFEPYGKGGYRLKDIEIPLKSVKLENVNDTALPIFAPLAGKKIANFGDSIFGNARPPEDVSTYLAEKTGAEVLNCAFGGCRMAIHNQLGHWNAFTMVNLAQAIASGDYSVQDEALNYDDRTSYAEQPLSLIKATNFSTVDILTIAYGTNDFTSNIPLENANNLYDTATLSGALRTSIESLLTAYPNLKIFVLSTMYRFYIDSNNEFTDDSNTKTNSIGLKLKDYNAKLQEVAAEYNLPYIDDYNIGIGKFNRYQYFKANDGAHHIESGRQLIAEHLATALCSGNNYCSANGVYERVEAPASAKIVPNKEYVFGEVTELTVSFAEGSAGRRNEYLFSFISGETATVLTLPSTVKWVNELTVESNKRYEISVVDDVALWCAVDMVVTE